MLDRKIDWYYFSKLYKTIWIEDFELIERKTHVGSASNYSKFLFRYVFRMTRFYWVLFNISYFPGISRGVYSERV